MENMQQLCEQVRDGLDAQYFEIISHDDMPEHIKELLDYIGISNREDWEQIENDCDFMSDENKDGKYYSDLATEWADNLVDIYYSDLWATAKDFQPWTEEAFKEWLIDLQAKGFYLEKIFSAGQYHYYSSLASEILFVLTDLKSNKE